MKLCIIIPTLNEQETIAEIIQKVPKIFHEITQTHIVVIDDGSTDETGKCALEAGAEVITHHLNRGVGAALQTGIEKALELDVDFMINMDGDAQFDPEDIPKLLEPLISGKAEFVTASRFKDKTLYPDISFMKFWGNKMMSMMISILAGTKYYDVSCGFRGYTRNVLFQLNLFGHFTYTQEMVLNLSFKGINMLEIPVKVQGSRKFGKSNISSNLLKYAIKTTNIIFRSFRDYKPMLVFGTLSVFLFIFSGSLSLFLLSHYLESGTLFPHKWAGFAAAFSAGIGVLIFTTGLVADMLARVRINQERILYILRKRKKSK